MEEGRGKRKKWLPPFPLSISASFPHPVRMRFAENAIPHPKFKLVERQTLATLGGGKERERSFLFPSQRPFRMVEKSEKEKRERGLPAHINHFGVGLVSCLSLLPPLPSLPSPSTAEKGFLPPNCRGNALLSLSVAL